MPRLFDPAIFDGPELFDTVFRVDVVVFPTVPPTLESVLRSHHSPVAQLEVLEDDLETVRAALPAQFLEGNVSSDRRTDTYSSAAVRLVATASDGTLRPRTIDSLIMPGRIVRLSRGAMVGSTPSLVPLITGVIEEPVEGAWSGSVAFSVASRLSLARRQFPEPITFPAGMRLVDVVRTIAELAGLGTSDALYDLDDAGVSLAASRSYDMQAETLEGLVKLPFDYGLDVWPVGSGITTMRPFVDPALVAPLWDFSPGAGATLVTLERSIRALRIYNRQVVIGTAPDGYPIRAEAIVTNPADPLYWTPANDRPAPPYISSDIRTQAAANAVALRLLFENALFEEILAGDSVPIPLVAARDVVRFADAGAEGSFLLNSVTMPIYRGSMRMATTRMRSLVA